MPVTTPPDLILYDGECGLCNRFVHFIIQQDRCRCFHFAAIQRPYAQKILHRFDIHTDLLNTLYVIPDYLTEQQQILTHSNGSLWIAQRLGFPWNLLLIFYMIPRTTRDWFYKLIARNRNRIFGKKNQCIMMIEELKERFID
ncbi:MAG: hypothetical protein HJJLKODD_01052 [Phycisphaerae bacterium]|nr:hypothetical protein [Phycisphaerae bacterium]